MHGLKWSSR